MYPIRAAGLLVSLMGALLLAACGGGGGGDGGGTIVGGGGSITLRSLQITPSGPDVEAGTTQVLQAMGSYSDGSTRDLSGAVSWSTSAGNLATVAGGTVTAIAQGTVTITASYSGITTTTIVTVTPRQGAISYLHIFAIADNDGGQPNGPLMLASDGNFYGTTRAGGAYSCRGTDRVPCGTIFRLTPGGQETVLHSFGATPTDGYSPSGALIQGKDGALYGTTSNGGTYGGGGTIFRITLDGAYSILHSFGATAADGGTAIGPLVQTANGDFYGTTATGGANHCRQIPQAGGNCGTIFRMSAAGVVTILYSFGAFPADGVTPTGGLTLGNDGNLYGTTLNGGANACGSFSNTNNCGTAFRITPAGVFTIIHDFGAPGGDGVAPQGGLLLARDGNFYGTTPSGGVGGGHGTVFRMTPAGVVTILHSFGSVAYDGRGPTQYLTQGSDGNIYGATGSGGRHGGDLAGTVFRLTPAGALSTLYSFGPVNKAPSNPTGGVIQGPDGALYGLTFYNGELGAKGDRGGFGTVFRLVPP